MVSDRDDDNPFRIYSLHELDEMHKDYVEPPYTAGPWRMEKDTGGKFTSIGEPIAIIGGDETGEKVRFTVGRGCDYGPHGPERTEANARLIAAAPDLLAACEAVISAGESENLPTTVYDAIETAIAKANGEGE